MIRIGMGHDTHRLADGGPLRLGGIDIPHEKHLVGHSDADVLMHAVTDAILGAANLPDIGELFPDTAAENKGRDSADFLRAAYRQVQQAGYTLVNVDCVVLAQRPKLSPHKEAMKARLAEILGVETSKIGIKGKTGESVGAIGQEQAITAQCVALVIHTVGTA